MRIRIENPMTPIMMILAIFLLVSGVFLVFAVLMQHGKSHGLSGAIAGGAETFFGKEKGKRWDKLLSKLTTIVSALFVVAALALFVILPDVKEAHDFSNNNWSISPYQSMTTTEYEPEKADK